MKNWSGAFKRLVKKFLKEKYEIDTDDFSCVVRGISYDKNNKNKFNLFIDVGSYLKV